jgi:hypothetical protein
LFTKTASIADLDALKRKYQKLINKYEQIPTPSHAKKNCKKYIENIKNIIKKVNKPRYA